VRKLERLVFGGVGELVEQMLVEQTCPRRGQCRCQIVSTDSMQPLRCIKANDVGTYDLSMFADGVRGLSGEKECGDGGKVRELRSSM
jgi:hypothetical protein